MSTTARSLISEAGEATLRLAFGEWQCKNALFLFSLWVLFNVKSDDSAHFFDGHRVFVGAVAVGDNDFGFDLIDVGAGIGDNSIGAFGITQIPSLEVANDGVDFHFFAKGKIDGLFYVI